MEAVTINKIKTYNKIIIYYFSGTGNAKNVALWFSQVANKNGTECQIINIAQIDRRSVESPEPDALVVFISPIHGFNYPPIMLNFLLHFPKGKNKVVLMNTRAGMLIGKFITPGLTGIAFYLSALILFIKGFSLKAILPVDMPSNWVSLHPCLNAITVKYLHQKNKERVEVFAEKIIKGKSHFIALIEIYDLLLTPIALAYFAAGRFFLAKTFYASSDCNNCDICINACPVKAIKKVDNRPFWTFNCESCMRCMSNCPQKAIETGHGYIAVFLFIFNAFILFAFYKFFNNYLIPINDSTLKFAAEAVLSVIFIGIWYRLVHWLLRNKLIERIIVYSSLTKIKWWGRYKALKENEY